jgi:hypothetical protein
MTTIQSNLNLQAFTDAARQLGEGTIRLKNDGSGIATSTWDRFVVRVVDFFSSAATVQDKELKARNAFWSAIETAHGPNFQNDFIKYGVGAEQLGAGAVRLDARVVSSYAASASQRGGQDWMSNEISIKGATAHPRVAALIASSTDRVLGEAVHLSGTERAALRERMMAMLGSQAGIGNLAMAIDNELRSSAQALGADGRVRNNLLDPATVATIADGVVTRALCGTANRPMFNDQQYKQELINRALQEGLNDFAHSLQQNHVTAGQFIEIGISFPVGQQTHILQGNEVDAMMTASLDAAIARQRTKMDQIALLLDGAPTDHPARRLLEQHFSEGRSKISSGFLVAVQGALQIPSPEDNEASLRAYASALKDKLFEAGAHDYGDRADFLYSLVCLDHASGRNGISAMVNRDSLMNLVAGLNDPAEEAIQQAALDEREPSATDRAIVEVNQCLDKMRAIIKEIDHEAARRA